MKWQILASFEDDEDLSGQSTSRVRARVVGAKYMAARQNGLVTVTSNYWETV